MTTAAVDFATWGPRDYVKLPTIEPHWKVLDVGPGAFPHPRADVYLDWSEDILAPLKDAGKRTILDSLEEGLPEVGYKAYDYVWCSHVLEHVEDPRKCAATLSRIAKRGTIVMPSAFKETLFNFEEETHKYFVMPHPTEGPPIFVRYNRGYVSRLRDQLVQKATCFLYRTGTHHDCTAERALRGWFQTHEMNLDVVHHWADQLTLHVIG